MRVRTAGGGRGALGHTPLERRVELNKRYKDKVEKLWAGRLLGETVSKAPAFPGWRQNGEVFGGHARLRRARCLAAG